MKTLLLIVFSLSLAACQLPQTKPEFREWLNDSHVGVTNKSVNLPNTSLDTVEKRMQSFAKKCLHVQTIESGMNEFGAPYSKVANTYNPSMEKSPGRVSLFLQQQPNAMILGKAPKEGLYVYLADATKAKNSPHVELTVNYTTMGSQGNIGEDSISWLTGQEEFCPEMR